MTKKDSDIRCGTEAGYKCHQATGERPVRCGPCTKAHDNYVYVLARRRALTTLSMEFPELYRRLRTDSGEPAALRAKRRLARVHPERFRELLQHERDPETYRPLLASGFDGLVPYEEEES